MGFAALKNAGFVNGKRKIEYYTGSLVLFLDQILDLYYRRNKEDNIDGMMA
jgi:hypothetical protein